MPGFLACERHRAVGVDGAQCLAGVPHDAAGHVHRNDRQAPLCRRPQRLPDLLTKRAAEPGTEDRIDHQSGALDGGGCKRLDDTCPTHRIILGIALQPVERAQQRNPHRPACVLKRTRNDEAVASVIAGTAQNRNGAGGPSLHDLPHHRVPGAVHQIDAGYACRDRQSIGLGHLRHGQQCVQADG